MLGDKIIVCDDEESLRRLICEALECEGYECIETSTARELWDRLEKITPDLILLDLKLPDCSGVDLLSVLKEKNPDILIIAVTAVSELNVAIKCIRQGAYDYITKPINIEELYSCVSRALENSNLQRQLKDNQHRLEEKVEAQAEEIRQISLGAISSLSFALESKDSYTAGHSRRVAEIGMAIGKKMGLSEDEIIDLRWGGLLHDLAKIAINQEVLNKEGQLTAQEYEHVMTHPIIGACLAGSLVRDKKITGIIQYHHARYDGKGIRQNLKGEEIPLLARIIALADAYDAMTSNRSYRDALTRETALEIIKQEAGYQFDPEIVRTFIQMSESEIFRERPVILIADDEESIRLVVKSVLGNDYTVIEVNDGQEVVPAALKYKPGLILMDIIMPIKDGVQACQEIKTNPETSDIPVIMLTGLEDDKTLQSALKAGSNGYIIKPFATQELMRVVQSEIRQEDFQESLKVN